MYDKLLFTNKNDYSTKFTKNKTFLTPQFVYLTSKTICFQKVSIPKTEIMSVEQKNKEKQKENCLVDKTNNLFSKSRNPKNWNNKC